MEVTLIKKLVAMPPKQTEKRSLPRRRNLLLAPENTPERKYLIDRRYSRAFCLTGSCTDVELVKRRRLGQTNLAVKPGQVGTSNATKPENLGMFDYAHLKAPLPENLKGSEILSQPHQPHPEAYFLMVRKEMRSRSRSG